MIEHVTHRIRFRKCNEQRRTQFRNDHAPNDQTCLNMILNGDTDRIEFRNTLETTVEILE